MEYIIIAILLIILIFVVLLFSKLGNNDMNDKLNKIEVSLIKEIGEFKNDFSRSLSEDFDKSNEKIDYRLRLISEKVNERLDENFEKANKTFISVLERLSKIDEAQKKIDGLSSDIVSLQSVLTDKKARGTFGEVNLRNIMASVFGDNNDAIYKMQYTFATTTIADCVLFAPEPLGLIAIDSKFPLENYQTMIDRNNSELVRATAMKNFKGDLKRHIDAIASKYIIPGVTTDQAIMFLPAEAIFAEIHAYHTDIIEYSYKNKVWITSPTTLMSTLSTVQIIMKNIERDKYASIIHKELVNLDSEFKRYKERWDKLSRSLDTVTKDVKDIHTTTEKISKRFDSINQVEIKEITFEE